MEEKRDMAGNWLISNEFLYFLSINFFLSSSSSQSIFFSSFFSDLSVAGLLQSFCCSRTVDLLTNGQYISLFTTLA